MHDGKIADYHGRVVRSVVENEQHLFHQEGVPGGRVLRLCERLYLVKKAP
jgi:hypothetical protein